MPTTVDDRLRNALSHLRCVRALTPTDAGHLRVAGNILRSLLPDPQQAPTPVETAPPEALAAARGEATRERVQHALRSLGEGS